MRARTTDIAVIGAGVIGLAIAERLAADGRDVVLIDPGVPGMGASFGNAGTIADYAVMPVGSPEVLARLPSLLLDRNSPLAIRRGAMFALLPWLARFIRSSTPAATARGAAALAGLLGGAGPLWRGLATRIGAGDLLQDRGCLYLYDTPGAWRGAGAAMAARRALGVTVDLLTADELAGLEPGLPPYHGAAFFPGALFLSDPGAVMLRLASHVATRAEVVQARAIVVRRQVDGVIVEGPGLRLHARRVVIAAGAHSRDLAASAGDRVPLDTERGYHAEWDMAKPLLARPVCPLSRGAYLCPMAGRLRVAGTVELGGLSAPPSAHRIARLVDGARQVFPDLGEPDRVWMGFRPSMPDSLPVIGPSVRGAEVLHAYGHGHIGVTLAPVTARIIADLVAGRVPEVEIAPYLPGRF
jgi:D-amino-acid dehydrogenase